MIQKIGWLYEEQTHRELNQEGLHYFPLYWEEIFSRLGLRAQRLPRERFLEPELLGPCEILVVPPQRQALREAEVAALQGWVRSGGILISSGAAGLEELCGVEAAGPLREPPEEYALAGFFSLLPHPLTHDLHPRELATQPLLTLAPTQPVRAVRAEGVAQWWEPSAAEPQRGAAAAPTHDFAITTRAVEEGWAHHFACDLAHTLWLLEQGRPILEDYDGDGYYRSTDAQVLGLNDAHVPYSEELVQLLRNMIAPAGLPLVGELPPVQGRVAQVLFFFGGDDEGASDVQLPASTFMAERGLPYHINCMLNWKNSEEFGLLPEDERVIREHGHELALHYDFISHREQPFWFTEEDVHEQAQRFAERFGGSSVCAVNHYATWVGGPEPARWMAKEGQLADNGLFGIAPIPGNVNPMNVYGFAFGSAFPHRVYEDPEHHNERMRFLRLPMTAYEVGYRIESYNDTAGDRNDFGPLHEALELAARYHLTANFFYHPVYVAQRQVCREAIDELLRYVRERGWRVSLMGPDGLTLWWLGREEAEITDLTRDAEGVSFTVRNAPEPGLTIRLPLGHLTEARAEVEGVPAEAEVWEEFGGRWLMIPVPAGDSQVRVTEEAGGPTP
jgi:hypothetical protein